MKGKVAVFTGPRQAMDIREYPLPEVGPACLHGSSACPNRYRYWRINDLR